MKENQAVRGKLWEPGLEVLLQGIEGMKAIDVEEVDRVILK